jgi:NADH dehydrogenase
VLLDAAPRVLPSFPADLSERARRALTRLGVDVRLDTRVTALAAETVTIAGPGGTERLAAHTVLWAAGVKASGLGAVLARHAGASLDGAGRVIVASDCTVPGHPELFVIGDLAHFADATGAPLPGVAQVAMQQGRHVARTIRARLQGASTGTFHYVDRGAMATIGRGAAVAHIGRLHVSGYPAWLVWLFVHLLFLVEFDNRLAVLLQWAWNYVTWNRGARLITGESPLPLVVRPKSDDTGTS